MLCMCIRILLQLYLCAFNDTQPHIVVDVLDNPTTRLELYLITLVNSWLAVWLAVSMSETDHIVDSELCVCSLCMFELSMSNVYYAHYDKMSFRKSFRKSSR